MGELGHPRRAHNPEVVGSNPTPATLVEPLGWAKAPQTQGLIRKTEPLSGIKWYWRHQSSPRSSVLGLYL